MARLSARSNPTGLKDVDRRRVTISISEIAGIRNFMLDRLDLKGTGLADTLNVVVVARAGNTNLRCEMGTVACLKNGAIPINGLDHSQPLRFRVLLHEEGNPKLVASIENLRTHDDSQSESLLPMEAAALGERIWRLIINEDGPVLQFNSNVFPNAAGAENYAPFVAMVLPEALRQVMEKVADDPSCLEDEDNPWSSWAAWLDSIGVQRPPVDDDKEVKAEWCNQIVDRFCERFSLSTRLSKVLKNGDGND